MMQDSEKPPRIEGEVDDTTVTSYSDNSDDAEQYYDIVKILAERRVCGVPKFLVEWENYPTSSATWEPLEHLEQDTIGEWEEFKTQTGRRTALGFRISDWIKAVEEDVRQTRDYHEAQNRKRVASGQQPTDFQYHLADYLEAIGKKIEDFEESDEETTSLFLQSSTSAGHNRAREQHTALHGEGDESHEPGAGVISSVSGDRSGHMDGRLEGGRSRPVTTSKLSKPKPRNSSENDASAIRGISSKRPSRLNPAYSTALNSPPDVVPPTKKLKPDASARAMTSAPPGRNSINDARDINTGANVFVGGKDRKNRPKISDVASDTTRTPKLLRRRHQNIVQKQLRDKDGTVEPAFTPGQLIPLGNSAPVSTGSSFPGPGSVHDTRVTSRQSCLSHHDSATEMVVPPKTGSQGVPLRFESGTLAESRDIEKQKKKRRSVRWDDTVMVREVPCSGEETVDTSHYHSLSDMADSGDMRSNSATGLVSVATQLRSHPTILEAQSVSMTCQLGTVEAQLISLTFHGLPGDANAPWLQHFKCQKHITFTHTCTAQDFRSRLELQQEQLCQGSISDPTDNAKLQSVANWLNIGRLYLMHYCQSYSILVFPSVGAERSNERKLATSDAVRCPLNYSIIRPADIFNSSMLAPLPFTTPPKGPEATGTPRIPVFDTMFGTKPDHLLPPGNAGKPKRNVFFLAFPPSARQEAYLVSQWLRYWLADCDIKSSLQPGDWSGFRKQKHGTLILHEDAIWAMRMFPNFEEVLHAPSGNICFYLFRRAFSKIHRPLSLNSADSGSCSNELCPIFPPNMVLLMTPSFVVSEPGAAYEFLRWFRSKTNDPTSRPRKLAVCAEMDSWLLDLAFEKSRELDNMAGVEERIRAGLTPKAVELRMKTANFMKYTIMGLADEDDDPIVFAPDGIAGDDEQSLVNWFGWWAIMNMDQFSRFVVLGSVRQHPARLSRLLQASDYDWTSARGSKAATDCHGDYQVHRNRQETWQLVSGDDGNSLCSFISRVDERARRQDFRPILIYKFPISYWDDDMARHFEDNPKRLEFKTYGAWLDFFADFKRSPSRMTKVNSLAGFFYTIDGKKHSQSAKCKRRPWIAIFRPMNPHLVWRSTELFIWDCTAWAKYPARSSVHVNELIRAQRKLVDIVQAECQGAIGLPLQQVWLGGSVADHGGGGFSQPLDWTLNWLEKLVHNVKEMLPAPAEHLPSRGWKAVKPAQAAAAQVPDGAAAADPMDTDPVDKAELRKKKTVFYAPGVDGQSLRPRCSNRLYEWAEGERRRGSRGRSEYTFEPTMKWYDEQVQRGHGLHHIEFSDRKSVFSRLNIDDAKSMTNNAAAAAKDRR